jgi:hypothetical protein
MPIPSPAETLATIRADGEHLTVRYRDRLVVNHALDRRLVSFQANNGETGSRWFKYKEGFSDTLIRYLLIEQAPASVDQP